MKSLVAGLLTMFLFSGEAGAAKNTIVSHTTCNPVEVTGAVRAQYEIESINGNPGHSYVITKVTTTYGSNSVCFGTYCHQDIQVARQIIAKVHNLSDQEWLATAGSRSVLVDGVSGTLDYIGPASMTIKGETAPTQLNLSLDKMSLQGQPPQFLICLNLNER
jgi:hypothetical protein